MRLLNARTIELVQFLPRQIPPYAILSHTWSIDPEEEVLFSDVGKEEAKQKHAYQQKLLPACRKTLELGIDYIWIDTCCIDKTSSAELQEAINSMFKWYSDSFICFVYLGDVSVEGDKPDSDRRDTLFSSRWFTRGWTLQELIAPKEIIFYSKFWDSLGTRESLANLISQITKIDEEILTEKGGWFRQLAIFDRSVANRMFGLHSEKQRDQRILRIGS
ncbi:heterokaryon incompatibility protein-domain-containing protein [Bisporella sp. PMI_857]|nr:heterokaryon incompatibility protein-domain-containing protein [Bisporella sp. PMI_857]